MLFKLGNTLITQKRPLDALSCYRKVLQLEPDNAGAHCNLGIAFDELGRPDEALVSCQNALRICPEHLESHIFLIIVLRKLGRLAESVASARQALQLRPGHALLHYNLGVALKQQRRFHEALASFRTAVQIDPDFADALSHLGSTLGTLGMLDEAQAHYRRVLQLKPDSDMAQLSLSMLLLASGEFAEGWEKFEYRWSGTVVKSRRPDTALPQWHGQMPQPSDGILIFEEQGAGDRIQFCRYLNLLKARFSGRVSMVVSPNLLTLFKRSFPWCEFLDSMPFEQSAWQWQCPLLSLPLAFHTVPETIPAAVPYLSADPDRVRHYQNKIATSGAALGTRAAHKKIGVVWKTTSSMANTAIRSIPFDLIAPLFRHPGTTWFSLQKEALQDEQKIVETGCLIDWAKDFSDFDDTAALIMNLDLVISVDTSVAHLAGALGKPVWLLNRHESEWRWMRNREDSPWYPSMHIVTQRRDGDWEEVISRLAERLCAG